MSEPIPVRVGGELVGHAASVEPANTPPGESPRIRVRGMVLEIGDRAGCTYLAGDVEVTTAALTLEDGFFAVAEAAGAEGPAAQALPMEAVLLALLKEASVALPRQVHERLVGIMRNVDARFERTDRRHTQALMRFEQMEARLLELEGRRGDERPRDAA